MSAFRRMILYLVPLLLMACSALLPLLFTKINDQRVLGQIQIRTLEEQPDGQNVSYSMIDKMHLLYEKSMGSPDIVVVQNAQLSAADMEKLGANCRTELEKLRETRLLPGIEDGFGNTGYTGTSYTVYDTTNPERVVTFYAITLQVHAYRISFTVDAETNQIYELNINSDEGALAIDIGNAYLHWQTYTGLKLVPSDAEASAGELVRPRAPDSQVTPLAVYEYTDGAQSISYSFFLANDGKRFTILLSSSS
ncbi:hypothetical protein MHI24_06970 [Paenibacillus sp. FSL K6-1096]|uniref:hypothetical protein n=1 Tax=Paenibacillus sp. FSL K6-1096 TaxID=2921460 RepID=UPI0030EB3306